ncbi:MAG TPA: flagellar basal-body rod protein FlgG, partial [Humisphaera sp.]|jgi:flagellar basal-body rod protein FlgG|nr:flagellar basal-body rod protein FlgG [Humisphaera sp.]
MAITALSSAATGLRALSTRIDVVANNLANAETTAFKASRVNFEDLMYLQLKQPGTTDSTGEISPAGIFVGLGTKISNTQLDLTQGSMEATNRPLDVGIQGNGFFAIKILDSLGTTGFTRNGNFFINDKGEMVLGMGDGYRLVPPIKVPINATSVSIGQDGTVSYTSAGTTQQRVAGQMSIAQFPNPQGLTLLGGSIYVQTDASGPPVVSKPGQQGAGVLLSNFLEASNVDPVKELTTLIKTQRAFELNSQSIQTADQALQTIANLRRG